MDIQRIKDLHQKHSKYYPAAFFFFGFLFDIITLGRIDDVFSIVQQAVYLALIGLIIHFRQLELASIWHAPAKLVKLWGYQTEALHFILGSLLSSYTLFYFMSASLSTSLVFMILIMGLLVANELPSFQRQSLPLKSALYYLCLVSFLSYLMPIILRFVSVLTLLLAVIICLLIAYSNRQRLVKRGLDVLTANRSHLIPAASVCGTLLVLYFLKLLPPIPVSVQYMGIYHKIEKLQEKYALSYDRPFWAVWQNGAQIFKAQPGDKIHVFARIFSPATIDDNVVFKWEQYINDQWSPSDSVSIHVYGGRDEGFRAYAVKSNYQPGEWRVRIETADGREMGRISFDIETTALTEREFRVDYQ